MMSSAWEDYEKIEGLPEEKKHRAWLRRYSDKGCRFSFSIKESKNQWQENYTDKKFEPRINLIERLPNEIIVEFDGVLENSKRGLGLVEKFIKKNGWGYVRSTHRGKSDYLWLQFENSLSDEKAKKFLEWIFVKSGASKIEGISIDENFSSSNKVFPVLFAPHRKYPQRELPIYFRQGKKIEISEVEKEFSKIKNQVQRRKEKKFGGFVYETAKKKEANFDFEIVPSDVRSLNELEQMIKANFPDVLFETKACASVFASMSLKNLNGCPSLNLIGNPSSEKTTVLSFFYGHELSYNSDDFTPRSFVSNAVNISKKDLEKIDLLPRIKNKILISPELAPLFEAPKEKILDNFSILTRVLDGEGLNRDSGVHGHRGYSGDYKFGWLGASTPLRASLWNIMGKIGNRLFFLNMLEKERKNEDYTRMFTQKSYEEKVKICRGAVQNFLNEHFKKFPVRSLDWDAEQDIFILQEIVKYAQFLCKLRGTLMVWRGEERGEYEHSYPIIEEPPRAINSLYNLAKGHALINDRTFLKSEDLEIVRAVTFSSMPHDRYKFLELLSRHEGRLTTHQIERELKCSTQTATRTMKIFEILGLVQIKNLHSDMGRPLNFIEINPEFSEILAHSHILNLGINPKFPRNNPVANPYEKYKVEDFVKNFKKIEHSQDKNLGINPKFPRNNPVADGKFEKNEIEEALE